MSKLSVPQAVDYTAVAVDDLIDTPQETSSISASISGPSPWQFDETPELNPLTSTPTPSSPLQQTETFGVPTPATTVSATGDNNIDGLLVGSKWSSTSVSFGFTDSIADYESGYPDLANHGLSFQTFNATQRDVARKWIAPGGEYYNVSLLVTSELTGTSDRDATIRMAMSNVPGTAFGYYPANTVAGGDTWFNKVDYNSPVIGNYAYHTFGHELGHALGLKHGHETGGVSNVSMNADRDSMEFSIMTYRSYVGHDLNALPYYTNETWGFAQSLMMYDIRAIQQMYGAWFGYNSSATTYTFSTTTGEMFVNGVGQGTPGANRIFRTVWDGNGIDTYDFSNYITNLSINLTPGGWSDLDVGGNSQRAMLNAGYGGITQYARGHVFNALQYNGDARSLIENAKGGSGNDTIIGNVANNVIEANAGNDTVDGGDGNDQIYLGDGNDSVNITSLGNDIFYGGNGDDFIWGFSGNETYYGEAGNDTLKGYSGNDTINGGAGADVMDGESGSDNLSYAGSVAGVIVNLATNTVTGGDATGDTIANFERVTGSIYGDTLTGSNGANNFIGGNGKDILTGSAGTDRFIYTALPQSRLTTYDIITDYVLGEFIDAPASVLTGTITTSVGNAASLSAANVAAVLTSGAFAANSAVAFTVTGQPGTFIALNDATAGFSSTTDSIIFLQNYTLGAVSVV